jgi:PAS domain S-box-containing protein
VWAEIWEEYRPIVTAMMAGESQYFVDRPVPLSGRPDHPMSWFTFSWTPVRDESGAVAGFYCVATETPDRGLVEATLRESGERQAFLLKLSDAVRPLATPVEIMATVSEEVGRYFNVGRCGYAEVPPPYDHLVVASDWTDGNMQSLRGSWPLASFGATVIDQYRSGQTVVFEDAFDDDRTRGYEAGAVAAGFVRSSIAVQLLKGGEWVATFYVQNTSARRWTRQEIDLMEEIAERTWAAVERVRAEAALQASEERYRSLFESIDQGFCTVEVLFGDDDRPVDYVFREINPAFARNTGLVNAVGRRMRELAPHHEEYWFETYGRIALTGEPVRFEAEAAALGRWYNVYAYRVGEPAQHRVTILFEDITKRRRAEAALGASEEHQAFMLDVSDTLRPLADPITIQATAARLLGEHLGASRAVYAEIEADDAHFTVHRDYVDGVPSFAGRYLLDSFGPGFANDFRAGRTVTVVDAERDVRVSEAERAVYAPGKVRAFVAVPLVKDGRLVADLSLHYPVPHAWSSDEVALVEEVAERTWAAVERARAEAVLQASEARHSALFDAIDEGVCLFERMPRRTDGRRDYRYLAMNPAMQRMFGVPDLSGQTIRDTFPDEAEAWYDDYDRVLETGQPIRIERESEPQDMVLEMFVTRLEDGTGDRLLAVMQDVTERRRAETALRESEQSLQRRVAEATTELRTLSRRLLSVQEEERRFLARELHDEIGQTLTGLGFQLGSKGVVHPRRLTEARQIVRELTDQVRQLSMDLRPAALDRYGLLPALQWHVERLHARTGLAVDFGHEGIDRRFPGDVEIAAYRIIQEALTNVARHAETSEAFVRVLADDDRIIVVVRDAGRGFDVAGMAASKVFGGMRERVALLGGTLAIDAAPGEGTVISAELPLDWKGPETPEEP